MKIFHLSQVKRVCHCKVTDEEDGQVNVKKVIIHKNLCSIVLFSFIHICLYPIIDNHSKSRSHNYCNLISSRFHRRPLSSFITSFKYSFFHLLQEILNIIFFCTHILIAPFTSYYHIWLKPLSTKSLVLKIDSVCADRLMNKLKAKYPVRV